jgi:ATP-dependent Clp protease ATP-binding subunit ClpX
MAKNTLHCSFCGRSRDEVKILIAGQEGHICENCVEHAQEIIQQELIIRDDNSPSSPFKLTVKKPIEIKRFLDEYIIAPRRYWPLPCTTTTNGSNRKLATAT